MTCLLEPQIVSCGLALTCDVLALSQAKDSAGREWVLMSPCVPGGWTQTSASATAKTCTICQVLSLSECVGATYCRAAQARQIDAQRSCLLPEEDVSCQPTTSTSGASPRGSSTHRTTGSRRPTSSRPAGTTRPTASRPSATAPRPTGAERAETVGMRRVARGKAQADTCRADTATYVWTWAH